ncbi:MAG: hypothetical protein K5888_11210, partial [Lachnospiraceae bacterium]|nr:hypothetical protein [Lachnospiraceae bacterium]
MKFRKNYGIRRILCEITALVILLTTALACVNALSVRSHASKPLDEILDYEINASVNDDATVTLTYHIEWKVLDSDSEGPLTWVKVGIPNKHYVEMTALTDNIEKIGYMSDSGSYARIDFDKKYYEDDVVIFEFSVVQDYMYQVDKLEEGFTVYAFT